MQKTFGLREEIEEVLVEDILRRRKIVGSTNCPVFVNSFGGMTSGGSELGNGALWEVLQPSCPTGATPCEVFCS